MRCARRSATVKAPEVAVRVSGSRRPTPETAPPAPSRASVRTEEVGGGERERREAEGEGFRGPAAGRGCWTGSTAARGRHGPEGRWTHLRGWAQGQREAVRSRPQSERQG